jgi:hypothetical protein
MARCLFFSMFANRTRSKKRVLALPAGRLRPRFIVRDRGLTRHKRTAKNLLRMLNFEAKAELRWLAGV